MRLFDSAPISETDITNQPGLPADVQGASSITNLPPPVEYETRREFRIEPPAPMAELRQPRSIMERLKELARTLVEPAEPGNYTTAPLYGIGRTIQAVGEGMRGRGGEFLQNEGALQERISQGIAHRALQAQQEKRHQQEFTRKRSEGFLGLLDRLDADDDTKTRALQDYLKNEPGLATSFPNTDLSQLRMKGSELEYKNYEVGAGEIADPRTGQPLPAGRYNLHGKMKNGQFVPSKIEPSTDTGLGKIGAVDPEKYEIGSVAKFKKTGNYADLVPLARADKTDLTLATREELKSEGIDPQSATPAQTRAARAQVQQKKIEVAVAQAGATTTARESTPTAQTDRQVKALERRRQELLNSSPLKSLGRPAKQHQAEFDTIDADLRRLRGGGLQLQSTAPLATGAEHKASVAPAGAGRIHVRDKQTGQTGTIPANEFDPKRYDRVK